MTFIKLFIWQHGPSEFTLVGMPRDRSFHQIDVYPTEAMARQAARFVRRLRADIPLHDLRDHGKVRRA